MIIKKLVLNRDKQTVFGLSDVARIVGQTPDQNLISAVSYYVKQGDLIRLSKGLYALDQNYLAEELGNKLRTPSYLSLYSVLQPMGIVFQPYESFYLISRRNERREIGENKFVYRKIKDEILLNPLGLEREGAVVRASVERALLDKLYLDGEEHFDNLREVDWDKMARLNREVYRRQTLDQYIVEMRKYA